MHFTCQKMHSTVRASLADIYTDLSLFKVVFQLQIPAGHLSSDVGQAEADMLYKKLHKRVPEIRMLYVTPEKVGALS